MKIEEVYGLGEYEKIKLIDALSSVIYERKSRKKSFYYALSADKVEKQGGLDFIKYLDKGAFT